MRVVQLTVDGMGLSVLIRNAVQSGVRIPKGPRLHRIDATVASTRHREATEVPLPGLLDIHKSATLRHAHADNQQSAVVVSPASMMQTEMHSYLLALHLSSNTKRGKR